MASTLASNTQSLELTDVEKTLRQLLLDVAEFVDSSSAAEDPETQAKLPDQLAREKIVLRFTGGWVRDKLLGVGSHDIDVAINKMTGFQFGLKLKEYLEIPGNPEKYGLEGVASPDDKAADAGTTSKSRKVGGLYKIEANPEKSKHLETVTTKILGLDIDLVNLRKETYTEDSRNPQMEFGTPEEDALRRDATVNALFYNINTSTIEDFTGRGFRDMEKRIIRTPLEPYQTFMDDPLRVLRLIRFASRLGYTIDPAAEECMKNAEIKEALRIKISRERVGIELEKMLKGPDPRSALGYIDRLDLYETIFTDPTKKVTFTPETSHLQPAYDVVSKLLANQDVPSDLANIYASIRPILFQSEEDQYHAWILAALVPWADAPQPEPKKAGGKIPPPLAESVVREGIKAPNKVCEVVTASVRNLDDIRQTTDKFDDHNRHPRKRSESEDWTARDTLGMAIRRWGATWRSQVVFALAYEVANAQSSEKPIVEACQTFLQHIQALNLLEAHTFTPIIDGRALSAALSTPPGKWMKDALDVIMAWQLRNPDFTDTAAAIEAVRSSGVLSHSEAEPNGTIKAPKKRDTKKKGEQSSTPPYASLIAALIHHFLALTIRPLFAQTPHPELTAQGRRNTTSMLARKYPELENEAVTRPWKQKEGAYAVSLLSWCIKSLDADLAQKEWPLLIPPILTMIDDPDIPVKARGCDLLTTLLAATPPTLLQRTGLGEVFEEALVPCLSYLPTLTPEAESIVILNAAFPALVALAMVRHPVAPTDKLGAESVTKRAKALDKLLRQGVLRGFAFAGEHVRIAEVLVAQLAVIVEELGVESVKHLKDVLPLLSNVLGEPFGLAYLPLVVRAVRALRAVVLGAWPRIGKWRAEVVRGVAVCWIRVVEEEQEKVEGERGKEFVEVKGELRKVVEVLRAAVAKDEEVDIEKDFRKFVEADERLRDLFEG